MREALTAGVLCVASAASAFAAPPLHPWPQSYVEAGGTFAVGDLPVFHDGARMCEIGALEIPAGAARRSLADRALPERGVFVASCASERGRELARRFALDVPQVSQGYALSATGEAVAIARARTTAERITIRWSTIRAPDR